MASASLTEAVRSELLAHPDVTEGAHRFGGVVFRLGNRELGHLHGETVADLPFAPHVCDELIASGRISPEHVVSESAWVSRRVEGPHDVVAIVELFRISLEQAQAEAALAAEEEPADEGEAEQDTGRRGILSLLPRRRSRRR